VTTLVIGGNGQLGRHLRTELRHAEFWDRSVVDLADTSALPLRLATARVSAIVNAAAYTAVDKAESEHDLAWRVNAEAPAALARAAERLGVPLIHISTDYVFDGSKSIGYTESDATRPLNQYGRSKLGGELAVASLCSKHWILRTSWVFSEHGSNFPKTMLRLARERSELRVVDDQHGRPVYAGDLARCVASLLDNVGGSDAPPWGLYHVGRGPIVTWRMFSESIFEHAVAQGLLDKAPRVIGIPTNEYPTPARRPLSSTLITLPAWARWMSDPFDWQRGIYTTLAAIKGQA
jgi:dTDP-4-dehydrorhamnose reductase